MPASRTGLDALEEALGGAGASGLDALEGALNQTRPPPRDIFAGSPFDPFARPQGAEPLPAGPTGFETMALQKQARKVFETSPPGVTYALESSGVGAGGAPLSAQDLYSFGTGNEQDRVARALKISYGKPVSVRASESQKGGFEYRNPETGKWEIFNKPGIDLGDLARVRGHAFPVAGELAANILVMRGMGKGGFKSSRTYQALVPALVGTLGEMDRLVDGRKKGMVDLSDEEIAIQALTEYGIPTMVGGLATGLGHDIVRTMIDVAVKGDLTAVTRLGKISSAAEAQARKAEGTPLSMRERVLSRATGEDIGLTLGQKMGGDAAAIEAALANKGNKAGELLRQAYRNTDAALRSAWQKIAGPAIPGALEEGGAGLREAAKGMVGAVDQRLKQAEISLNRREAVVRDRIGTLAPTGTTEVGSSTAGLRALAERFDQGIRHEERTLYDAWEGAWDEHIARVREQERAAFREQFLSDKKFPASYSDETINAAMPAALRADDPLIPVPGLERVARDQINLLDQNAFPSLTAAERRAAQDALEGAQNGMTLKGMNLSLSVLKRTLREADAGLHPGLDRAVISRLVNGLQRARNEALTTGPYANPQLAEQIGQIEQFVSRNRDLVDRSLIGDIMKQDKGRFVHTDSEVFKQYLQPGKMNREGVDALLLMRSRMRNEAGAMDLTPEDVRLIDGAYARLRSGMMDDYQTAVWGVEGGTEKTLKTLQERHAQWAAKLQKSGMDRLLTQEERVALGDVREFYAYSARRQQGIEDVRKGLKQTLAWDIANEKTNGAAFRNIWDTKDPTKLERFQIFTSRLPPEEAAAARNTFNAAVRDDLERAVATRRVVDGETLNEVNGQKLLDYIHGTGKDPGHAALLAQTHGVQYVRNLENLAQVLRAAQTESSALGSQGALSGKGAVMDLVRAYIGIFTRPGRIATAGLRLSGARAEMSLVRALTDPAHLARVMEMDQLGAQAARGVQMGVQMGAPLTGEE